MQILGLTLAAIAVALAITSAWFASRTHKHAVKAIRHAELAVRQAKRAKDLSDRLIRDKK